ncbi:MAG: histidinol-phosphate transaminase [Fulvivirga sp.]
MKLDELVRSNILSLKAYSSARDEYTGDQAVMLNANENPFTSEVNRYPDPYQRTLKQEIAKIKGVKPSQIFLGNGSDEAIDLLFRIFCEPGEDNIVITEPTYGMYEVSAGINDVEIKKASLKEDFSLDANKVIEQVDANTKLIFLCSPNNPSGNLLDSSEVMRVIEAFDGIVVVDEAYIDFAETTSLIQKMTQFENLVILQTFSKAWGMAGVRLGMAFANANIISYFNKVKPPYNINSLTQTYALEQLAKREQVDEQIAAIKAERKRLEDELSKFDFVKKLYPSDSNFILVKFDDANRIYNYLVEKRIIVRDRSKVKFGENCLRITVGTDAENILFINALSALEQ